MGASHFTVLQLLAHLAQLRRLLEEGGQGAQELRWRGVQEALSEKRMDLEEVFTLADFEKVLLGTSKEAKEDPLSEQALQVSSLSTFLIFLILPLHSLSLSYILHFPFSFVLLPSRFFSFLLIFSSSFLLPFISTFYLLAPSTFYHLSIFYFLPFRHLILSTSMFYLLPPFLCSFPLLLLPVLTPPSPGVWSSMGLPGLP